MTGIHEFPVLLTELLYFHPPKLERMQKIREAVAHLQQRGIDKPEIGIILGTGLGKMVNEIDVEVAIPYDNIPHFPVSTVEFHRGELLYGTYMGKKVLAMHGRFHIYEGYSAQEITLPIRVMKLLGIRLLLISNAGGAMNLDFKKSELMLLTDHINLLPNPLIGPNYDEMGTRFPDMSQPYSRELNSVLIDAAKKLDIKLNQGVYVAVTGPSLETPAEYRYLRRIGADVVGMSTTLEVIVANHVSLPVAAISVITDECDPDNLEPIDINDILLNASKAEHHLIRLFREALPKL
jgi:purine-nucleoside phosphorylase